MELDKFKLDLSREEVRLICELLSGRISSEYFHLYHSPISSTNFRPSHEVCVMLSLRKRLGCLIDISYT